MDVPLHNMWRPSPPHHHSIRHATYIEASIEQQWNRHYQDKKEIVE